MTYDAWRRYFEQVIAAPEAEINLAEAALVLAADEYPELDVEFHLLQIREMARHLEEKLPPEREAHACIQALNDFLFDELDFHGNVAEYYDPRNSYLNDVLDRRTGLPIALCVLVLAIARELDLPILGVGLPGHFVVKWKDATQEVVFDPFHRGQILDRRGIEERVRETVNPLTPFQAGWLSPVGTKYILGRMLHNLKAVFVHQDDSERAWMVTDKLVLLEPTAGDEIRDLGLLSLKIGAYRQAAISLEQYLLSHSDAEDAPLMRVYLRRALEQVERLN